MKKITRCTSMMFVVALLVGLTVLPGFSQDDSSDQEAVKLLEKAAKNSLNSGSYTMVMNQDMKQTQSMSNMTVNRKSTGTIKYENPYIHFKIKTEVSGGPAKGRGQSQVQEMLGKQNDQKELDALYQKAQGGDQWTKMNSSGSINFKKMFSRFQDPNELTKQVKNVQFDGEETVNGQKCRKINAEQKGSFIEKTAKDMMKGASKNSKMLKKMDLSVNVKESDMNIWIRKDSTLIEKVAVDTKQTVTMSINIRGNKQSFDMKQDLDMESTYSDYDSTTVPQKLKDKIDSLMSNN